MSSIKIIITIVCGTILLATPLFAQGSFADMEPSTRKKKNQNYPQFDIRPLTDTPRQASPTPAQNHSCLVLGGAPTHDNIDASIVEASQRAVQLTQTMLDVAQEKEQLLEEFACLNDVTFQLSLDVDLQNRDSREFAHRLRQAALSLQATYAPVFTE